MPLIQSTRVTEIFMDCLLKADEISKDNKPIVKTTVVEGINITVHLHKKRLESHKKEIESMIDNLSEVFYKGYSFINMCLDKNEEEWTSIAKVQQELLLLALGIDKMRYCLPKEEWDVFPYGVPYVISKFKDGYLAPVFN